MTSAPFLCFPGVSFTCTTVFQSNWLFSPITIIETMISSEKEINTFPLTIIKTLYHTWMTFNPLTNNNFLDWPKLKAFADNKNKCGSKIEICFWKNRKHCGKRRKCWLQAFSPFPTMFSSSFFFNAIKSGLCGKGLTTMEKTLFKTSQKRRKCW